jgi:hypothetical protein
MSFTEVACWILRFAHQQPHQARNAFSAFLLIPGWEPMKFSHEIKLAKRIWESSGAKYAEFWDAKDVLQKLMFEPLDWSSVPHVREITIVVLRFFHLCRSIDLAQAVRTSASMDKAMHVMLKRKGRALPVFEQLIS